MSIAERLRARLNSVPSSLSSLSPRNQLHMTSAWARAVCRLSIALAIWMPYQVAQAGMIGTGQSSQTSQTDRGTVLGFVARGDVAGELQSFGLDPSTAKARVAAM